MSITKNFYAASVEGIDRLAAENLDDAIAEVKGNAVCDGNVYIFHFRHEAEEKKVGQGVINEVVEEGDGGDDDKYMAELREELAEWREKHSDEIVATVKITRDFLMERRARRLREFCKQRRKTRPR